MMEKSTRIVLHNVLMYMYLELVLTFLYTIPSIYMHIAALSLLPSLPPTHSPLLLRLLERSMFAALVTVY